MSTSAIVLVGTVTKIESAAPEPGGSIYTYVHIRPELVIKGRQSRETLVLREPGGTVDEEREWVFGAPEFWVGERSLLFLSRNADGTLQTNSLSMGKFTLSVDAAGHAIAMRDFGYGATVYMPASGQMLDAVPEKRRLGPFVRRLHHLRKAQHGTAPAVIARPTELEHAVTQAQENFTYLGSPARWFEPDSGLPVSYMIDSTGDKKIGFAGARAAIDAALAAWTNVPTSSLILADGGTTAPTAFAGCGSNRIIFNDSFNEVTDPSGCSGILAMGGFCTTAGSTVVNGTTFSRISVGMVVFNNGWSGCAAWNQCNLAEVATHEIGHTIGLGHSADASATMAARAHFDGRCAGLMADDIAAVNFIYPQSGTPTRTPTRVAPLPTRTPTALPTRTPTPTRAPATSTRPAATPTFTRVPVATRTPTLPAGAAPTPWRRWCFPFCR